jgi:hypothetical protein
MSEAERLLARIAELTAMQAALEHFQKLTRLIKPTRKEDAR